MPKNPVRTRVRYHRRRRNTNDMFTVLSSLLRNKIVQMGGGKPISIEKFRKVILGIAQDTDY
jgi:hypothetical protein